MIATIEKITQAWAYQLKGELKKLYKKLFLGKFSDAYTNDI